MEDKYIKLSDAKNAIADYIAEQTVSKYGSLEACRDAKFAAQGAMKELDYIPTADVVPKSEVEKLELTLQGVMWSVDKWLDETDYDADPIKRAITMREKTLKIVENLKAEVAREIFAEIESVMYNRFSNIMLGEDIRLRIAELKKKYTEETTDGKAD